MSIYNLPLFNIIKQGVTINVSVKMVLKQCLLAENHLMPVIFAFFIALPRATVEIAKISFIIIMSTESIAEHATLIAKVKYVIIFHKHFMYFSLD